MKNRRDLSSCSWLVACAVVMAGLAGGPSLSAQTPAPADPAISPVGTPVAALPQAPASSAAPIKTPAEVEREHEQQVLNQERLIDNQEELQLDVPALSGMNQSALSTETEWTKTGVNSGGIEVSGGYMSNLYSQPTNGLGSFLTQYSLPVTLDLSGERTRFHITYLPQFTLYAEAPGVYQTHVYGQTLLHSFSARTTLSWQLVGAYYRDVGQFLPTVLPVGGVGIAQPIGTGSAVAGTSTISNVATSVALLHRMTARDQITYTGTAAWNELRQSGTDAQPVAAQVLRNEPFAGDVLYEHTVTPSTFVGVEGTAAYVRGLSTLTNLTYETVLGTLRYGSTRSDSFSFSAGPMVRHSSGNVTPTSDGNGVTYAMNVSYLHKSHLANVQAGYARVIQLSLDNSALPAHQLAASFGRPITRHLDLTADARYIRAISPTPNLNQSSFGGGLRVDYRTGTRLSWFANASDTYSSQPTSSVTGSTTTSFTRGEINGGVRLALDRTTRR